MDVCAILEKIPSSCSWDIAFTWMGWTDNKNTCLHGYRWCGGIKKRTECKSSSLALLETNYWNAASMLSDLSYGMRILCGFREVKHVFVSRSILIMHIFIEINLKCANINKQAISKAWDSSMWKGKTSSSHILSLSLSHFNHTVLLRPQKNVSVFSHVSYMRKFFFKVIFLDSLTLTLIIL